MKTPRLSVVARCLAAFLGCGLIASLSAAPTITVQPNSTVSVVSGSNLSLSVTATVVGTASYQWQFSTDSGATWANVPTGATGTGLSTVTISNVAPSGLTSGTATSLSINNAQASNTASYRVVVTDSSDSLTATSNTSVVTFSNVSASVVAQSPSTVNVSSGGAARLFFNLAGSTPFTIQWKKDGVAIPGYSGTSFRALDITKVTAAQAGTYTVDITNAFGTATFSPVTLAISGTSDPLDQWSWVNPDPQGNNMVGMAVRPSDGRVVMVGRGGSVVSTIAAGENDSFFTNTGTTLGLGDVVWDAASSQFVAAGGFSTIVASSDGQTWTNRSMVSTGINDGYNGIATNGTGAMVVVGGDFNPPAHAIIRYSSNSGATWSAVASPPATLSNFNSTLTSAAYGSGKFVAVGTSGMVTYSPDNGVTWTMGSSGTTQTLQHVSFGNGVFVAVGNNGTILTSTDGQTFTAKTSGTTQALFGVNYLTPSTTWAAVGAAGTVVTSADNGVTWTAATAPGAATSFTNVGANASYTFVIGGFGRILAAANPATFSPSSLTELGSSVQSDYSTATFINHVEWDSATNQFVAVGSGGNVHTSSDGGQWNRRAVLAGFLSQVGRFGSKLVATGSGSVFTSTDGGSNWTPTSTFGGTQLNSVATSSAQAVVVGNAGAIYTSPDAATWTSRTSGTPSILKRVVNGNGRFVAVGGNDTGGTSIAIATSDDGVTWTARTAGTTGQLWGVDYANSTFVAVGSATVNGGGAFALRSTDNGVTWSRVEIPGATFLYSVRYQAGRWIAAGSANVLAVSTDNGVTWTYKPVPAVPVTNTMRSVAYGAGSMVVVGNDATILRSGAFPPTITAQPAGGNAVQGANFMLSVAANGAGQLNYQWYHNGVAIATNGTFPTLYVNNFQPADAGSYYVVVTSNGNNGTATTQSATATVSLASGAGSAAIDYSYNLPQFRRNSLPGRITADQVSGSGKIYANFTNGNTISSANNQRIGELLRLNANGTLDTSFHPNALLADAWAVVPMANGQVLVGGVASDETNESGLPNYRIFRLNGDGSRDYSYNSPIFSGIPRYMTLQPADGKLLVAPSNVVNSGGLYNLIRLNADGSYDSSFAPPSFDAPNPIFATIVVDPAGKILIGGTFNFVNGTAFPGVARLNANGTLDGTFVPSGFTRNNSNQIRGLALQTQGANAGKILVAGGTITVTSGAVNASVIRLLPSGAIDASFNVVVKSNANLGSSGQGVRPRLLNVLPDDRFTMLSAAVTRYTTEGLIDSGFTQANLSLEAFWMDTLTDGSVLVTPEFGATVNGTPVAGPFKLTSTGALDGTFTPPTFQTEVYPGDFAIQPDGRVLIWGNFDTVNSSARSGMARINTNGTLDSFNLSGVANLYSIRGAKLLADGRILAATRLGTYTPNLIGGVSRFNADGTVDGSFTLDPLANASSVEALDDGRILTWNQDVNTLLTTGGVFFKRLAATGAIDNTFTGLGSTSFAAVYRNAVTPFAITSITQGIFQIAGHYSDGRAIAISTIPNGSYPANATSLNVTLIRLNVDGTLDAGFTAPSIPWSTSSGFTVPVTDPQNAGAGNQQFAITSVNGSPFSGVVPQADGSVIVYGSFTSLGGNAAPGIARLTNTGGFDATFTVGSGPELRGKPGRFPQVENINTAPDGKLWISGLFDTFGGVGAPGIVRLNTDGTVDSTFGTNLYYSPYLGNGTKVGFGPAGQIYVAGTYGTYWGDFPSGLHKLGSTVAPAITTQPVSQATTAGGTVTFSVGVTPGLTAGYQWFLNGTAISGATNATLVIANVAAGNLGNYTVSVTTASGTVTSSPAVLSDAGGGAGAPTITVQPANTAIGAGSSGSLSVTATGTVTGYQWRKFGQPIAGATTATLSIPSAGLLDVGLYDVQIYNGLAITTSTAARIDVNPASYGTVLRPRAGFAPVFETFGGAIAVVPAPGGAFYIFGNFTSVDGSPRPGVARILANGSFDSSYAPVAISAGVNAAVLQPDGKLIIGGNFRFINGVSRNFIARLNTDGTLDTGFAVGSGFGSTVNALALQADGKVVVGGNFFNFNGTSPVNSVARLNTNGTLDTSFVTGTGFNGGVNAVALDGSGNIVVGGVFSSYNGTGTNVNRLARLSSTGVLDTAFGANVGTTLNSGVNSIAIYPAASAGHSGQIVVGGYFTGATRSNLTRFNANGTVDSAFMPTGSGLNGGVLGVALQSDDSILAVGFFSQVNGATSLPRSFFARLSGTDGSVDTGFNPTNNGLNGSAYAVAVMTDGKIVAGGFFTSANNLPRYGVARFNLDGSDASVTASLRQPGFVSAVVPAAGGKWAVAGNFNFVNNVPSNHVARLNADGSTDGTFSVGTGFTGSVNAMVGQADGKLVVGGYFYQYNNVNRGNLARLNTDGSLDSAFSAGAGFNNGVLTLGLQADGKLVVGGIFTTFNGSAANRIARLNTDASLDTAYATATGSGFDFSPVTTAVQNNGTVLLGGSFTTFNGTAAPRLAKLLVGGALDTAYGATLGTGINGNVSSLVTQLDGKVLVVGGFPNFNGTSRGNLARLTAAGSLDTAFMATGSGFNGQAYAATVQGDGKVVVGGNFTSYNNVNAPLLARLNGTDGTLDTSFSIPSFILGVFNNPAVLLYNTDGSLMVGGGRYDFAERQVQGLMLLEQAPVPAITAQPVTQVGTAGGSVTFSVTATGSNLAYQWLKNGVAIGGATGASYTIPSVQPSDLGNYSVVITNAYGTVTSSVVTISTSGSAATINTQPADVNATAGSPATLSVSATGTSLTYQWRRNGFPISGATAATYNIPVSSRTDADYYDVIVYSGLTPVTSAVARLNVAPTASPTLVAPDPSWNLQLEGPTAQILASVPLADGSFYAAGNLTNVGGLHRTGLFRVNSDGTVNTGFVSPEIDATVNALAVQSDGKVIIGGSWVRINGLVRPRLARLNTDGSLDASFNAGLAMNSGSVTSVAIQSDGKFLAAAGTSLLRFNADGSRDIAYVPTFNNTVQVVALQGDGKAVVAGFFTTVNSITKANVARLNTDGTLDTGFDVGAGAANATINALVIQADGKIVVGGAFTTFTGVAVGRITRLTATGALDTAFNTAAGAGFNGTVSALTLDGSQKIVAGGSFGTYAGVAHSNLARVNTDGSLDATFAGANANMPNGTVSSVAVSPGGQVVVGGNFFNIGAATRNGLARYNSDGTPDATVSFIFRQQGGVNAIVPLPGGKFLLGGFFTFARGVAVPGGLIRVNANGTVDTTFNTGGAGSNGSRIVSVIGLPDGRIAIGGQFQTFNGVTRNRLAVLNADGSINTAFALPATGLDNNVTALGILPGNRLVVGGAFSNANGVARNRIAAFNLDGSLDTAFVPTGTAFNSTVNALVVQRDGKVVVGGLFTSFNGTTTNDIARLNADGTLDTAFTAAGGTAFNSQVNALAIRPDGKIVVGGGFGTFNAIAHSGINRLNTDGSQDATFTNGAVTTPNALVALENNSIISRGGFIRTGVTPLVAYVERINPDGTRDAGFQPGGIDPAFQIPSAIIALDDGRLLMSTSSTLQGIMLTQAGAPPVFTSAPANANVTAGATATFTVSTAGNALPVSYQWFFNGAAIPGATGASYTINNVQLPNTGSYYAVATNELGSATSATATLSGTGAPPTIIAQPTSATLVAGANGSFSVTASGTGALTYQWRKYGIALAGATGATLSGTGVDLSSAGYYDVVVSNGLTSVVSNSVRLDVKPASYPGALRSRASYNARVEGVANVTSVASQADGSFYAVGTFTTVDGVSRQGLARFTAAGALDTTFTPPTLTGGSPTAAVIQPDGKLILGGNFIYTGGVSAARIQRFNTDGSLDTSFNPGSSFSAGSVNALALQPDGKIIVGGTFTGFNGFSNVNRIARLTSTGLLDQAFTAAVGPGFNSTVSAVVLQADGKIVAGGLFTSYGGVTANRLTRLNTDGTLDTAYNNALGAGFSSTVSALAMQADGKVVVGGGFATVNGAASLAIARLNTDGSRDATLVVGTGFNSSVACLAIQPSDGKIVVGGSFSTYNGATSNRLARLDSAGVFDAAFNGAFGSTINNNVNAVAVQVDGRIVVGGFFNTLPTRGGIARLNSTGSLDATVASVLRGPGTVSAILPDYNGTVIIGGSFNAVNGVPMNNIARLNADSSVDTSFVIGTGFNNTVSALALAGDDAILVGGAFTTYNGVPANRLVRLTNGGGLVTAFNSALGTGFNGTVNAIAQIPDGRIMVAGSFTTLNNVTANRIARLGINGGLDATFVSGTGFDTTVSVLGVQSDGKVIAGGSFTNFNGSAAPGFIARLTLSGTLDPTFTTGTGFDSSTTTLVVQPDNKVIVGGNFSSFNGTIQGFIARLNATGTLDTTYNTGTGFTSPPTALALQADGKLVAAGAFGQFNGQNRFPLARINTNGSLDNTFGAPIVSFSGSPTALVYNADGSLLMGGSRVDFADKVTSGLTLLEANPTALMIIRQPFSSNLAAGSASSSLLVNAVGVGTINYQWQRNGVNLTDVLGVRTGSTTGTLTLSAASAADAGTYTAVVTDSTGATATSIPAVITVTDTAPAITSQPSNSFSFVVQAGTVGAMQFGAVGAQPMTAQWQKNGVNIPGTFYNSGSFQLPVNGFTPADSGAYGATATNGIGSASTAVNRLFVTEESGWTWHNPVPTLNVITTLAVVNNQFLLTGLRGLRVTTADGTSFTQLPSLSLNNLLGYAAGNGRHVMLGSLGYTAVSTDGINWQSGNLGSYESTQSLAFGSGLFVAASVSSGSISGQGKLYSSPDGITWTQRLASSADDMFRVTYGNGTFAVLSGVSKLYRSTDGLAWSVQPGTPAINTSFIDYANGLFFLGGSAGELYTSPDAINWTARNSTTGVALAGVGYRAGQYVLVGANGVILTSPDAVTWTARNSGTTASLGKVAFANGTWLAISNNNSNATILTSPDGITWTLRGSSLGGGQTLFGVATDGSSLVAVGSTGTILRSTNGTTWAAQTSGTTNGFNDIAWNSGTYYAAGNAGTLRTSADGGITWNAGNTGTGNALRFIDRLNGTFVTVGDGGTILTSLDGLAWTLRTSGTGNQLLGAAFGAGSYVAVGGGGTVLTSPDAVTWTARNSGVSASLNEVAFGNGVFTAVGQLGTVLTSADGITWTPRGFNVVDTYQSVQFSNGWFFVVGGNGTVYASTDGINWSGRNGNFSGNFNETVAFNGRLYGVGNGGVILSGSLAPVVVQQPAALIVAQGATATFRVLAGGSALPVTYQWRKAGTPISGATNASYKITNVQPGDAASYDVILTTTSGSVTSSPASLTVNGAPGITTQPVAGATPDGGSVDLFVTASGVGPFTYQWFKNGVAIVGATAADYFIDIISPASAGSYTVTVTSAYGSTTSNAAVVSVTPSAPVFGVIGNIFSNFGRVLPAGTSDFLSVAPQAGTAPITYQWIKDGVDISGATGPTYYLSNWQPANAGAYSVRATNSLGTVISPVDFFSVPDDGGWTWRNPLPNGNWLTRVFYLNGQFMAGGLRGTLMTSPDGLAWTQRTVPAANNIFRFEYVGGRYIAMGSLNAIFTSPDAVVWTPSTTGISGVTSQLQDMTSGGGKLLAIGSGGVTALSTDAGLTWTPGSIGNTDLLSGLNYVLNKFYAVSNTGKVYSTADGVTWTSVQTSEASLNSLSYGAGRLVAVGSAGAILTSANGTIWTPASSGSTAELLGVNFVNNQFVVTGAPGAILTSPDGLTWTARSAAGSQSNLQSVAYGNGRYVMTGQQGTTGRALLTSTDAVTWTSSYTGPMQGTNLLRVATDGAALVAVGNGGAILGATNPASWTTAASGTTQTLTDVAAGAGKFVAVGDNGTVDVSTDATTWTVQANGTIGSTALNGVNYDGSLWVAVGNGGKIFTAPDAPTFTWTTQTSGVGNALRKVTFANGLHVAVGQGGIILTSPNATTWTSRASSTGLQLNDVTYGNGTYVAVGNGGIAISSTDGGVTWTPHIFTNQSLSGVTFTNGYFLATANSGGGVSQGYFLSTDGVNWNGRYTGSRDAVQHAIRFNNLVVGVGNFGTILTAGAPVLASPPSFTVNGGSPAQIKVAVSNSPFPVTYSWTKDTVAIGATSPILSTSSAQASDAGTYVMTATNAFGSVVSAPITLTLNIPLAITTQPANATVITGQTANFSVVATGSPAPTYQWRVNGIELPGAISSTLALPNVQTSGAVTVLLTNSGGTLLSNVATLTVNPVAPVITSPLTAVAVVGAGFNYQIATNQTAATFSSSALPAGLTLNAATGNISGTPSAAPAAYPVTITATNVTGFDTKTLTITVQPPAPVITSALAVTATAGSAFNFTLTTSSAATFGATGLPAGLTLTGAVISGIPTVSGTITATITATNATGAASAPLTFIIAAQANLPVFAGSNTPSGTAGDVFSFYPNFGAGITAYALVPLPGGGASVLPTGLTLNTVTGQISGSTTQVGTFQVAIRATNANGNTTVVLAITINPASTAPVINSLNTATATVGVTFNFTVTASPAATSFTASGLPAGLSFNTATGVISGDPVDPTTSNVVLTATNATGTGPLAILILTVNASASSPVITSAPVVTGRVGDVFSYSLTGSNTPLLYSKTSGSMPPGLAFNAGTGAITGTPTAAGTTKVWFAGTNAFGRGPSLEVTFSISPSLTLPVVNSNGSATGQVGQPFQYQITASNTPTSFGATGLPAGLSVNTGTGVISGIPSSATATPASVSLTATNGDGTSVPKILSLTITAAAATPQITSANTAGGRVGTAFSYQITASGTPTSFVATGLPAGLSADPITGAITGTPTAAGTFVASLQASNASGLGLSYPFTVTIASAPLAPAITSDPSATGQVGVAFAYITVAAPGPIVSYGLTGTLPLGLALNTATGILSGTPAETGLFTVSLTATNADGTSQPQTLVLKIDPAANVPVITSATTATATVGTAFTYQITATNVPGTTPFPPSVTLDATGLPAGLAVNPSSGLIQGTPTTAGTFTAWLVGTNANGQGALRSLVITVSPAATAPVVNSSTSASAQVGTAFSYQITATNIPTAFEALGAPAWLGVNTATGVLSGIPTAPGSVTVQVQAGNSAGTSNPVDVTISIAAAANTPVVSSDRAAGGQIGTPFTYTIVATGTPTSYLATGVPPGLSINTATGVLSGTPTASGTFNVTISASNGNGQGQPVTLVLTIASSFTIVNGG